MQTMKSNDFTELKKTICKNYVKDSCPYGKECRFRHPPKQQQEKAREVCKYFLQNKCKRGAECPFLHQRPRPEQKQRYDWLTFCLYFPNGQCKNQDCRFLHISEEDKQLFRSSGKIGPHLVEQAMCKALLQDVTLDGITPTCKEYLQGRCEWMSCPLLHLSRHEFSDSITDIMRDKFEAVLGSPERYHGHQKSAYASSGKYNESYDFMQPPLREPYRQDRYASGADESYGDHYGKKPSWYNERVGDRPDYDQQEFVEFETNKIIKGIYNLMKADVGFLRNTEKYETTDLRSKLNTLAEENARYRYEFSRFDEGARHRPQIPSAMTTEEYKYQDMVRRLERENMEMRRELSFLHGREENPYSGRFDMHQGFSRGSGSGHGHSAYDRRMYGIPKAEWDGRPFNPVKHKINSHLKYNMQNQYKNPQQMKHGQSRSQKYNLASKKNVQKKVANTNVNKNPNKPLQKSNQAKLESAKNITQDKDNKESVKENENASGDSGDKPIVDAISREAKCEGNGAENHSENESESESDESQGVNKEIGSDEAERENKEVLECDDSNISSSGEEPEPEAQGLDNEKDSMTLEIEATNTEES